jgi:hypothetical protein
VRLEIGYRSFVDGKNRRHFLLANATLRCRAAMADGTAVEIRGVKATGVDVAFTVDLTPALIPKQLTRLELTFEVPVTLDGQTFTALRIAQTFIPIPVSPNSVATAEYRLTPAGWRDALGRLRISNMATHPLLDATGIAARRIVLNALFLDLTDAWLHLHRTNENYRRYRQFGSQAPSTFKVFAHLAGNPLIWYSEVPTHLRGAATVSPHVFFQPDDRAESQNTYSETDYLKSNARHFEKDGKVLFHYLAPPVDDVKVNDLQALDPSAERRRNVVGFDHVVDKRGRPTAAITTKHWRISAGFQKAFFGTGGGKPAQFLLMPQRVVSGSTGSATSSHLKIATDTIVDLVQTNTLLLSGAADIVITKGKMVLSTFSEAGVDLWLASSANRDQIKAIVAIEPQNLNTITNDYRKNDPNAPEPLLGKKVIAMLLQKNVAVFMIGRHHLPQYRVGPELKKVRLLPENPAAVFAYPPNPAVNDFVKYRVHRITNPATDPYMLTEETAIIVELTQRGIVGAAALAAIFVTDGNKDAKVVGIESWYSHHFALSGGVELKLDPSGVYDKPITYRTFFQSAVAEIG